MFSKKQYPWYFMSICNALTTLMCFLPLIISIITFESDTLQLDRGGLTFIICIFCIFLIPSAISSAQLLSVPFALLKQISPTEYFGFYVGFLNCAIIVAQLASYITSLFMLNNLHDDRISGDPYESNGSMIILLAGLSIGFYLLTCILSVFIKRVYSSQNRSEYTEQMLNDSEE